MGTDAGLLWMECKQMYNSGLRVYLLDNYNWIDFIVLSLYLASYVLRFLVDHWIKQADRCYQGTDRARESLSRNDFANHSLIEKEIFSGGSLGCVKRDTYYMKACKCIFLIARYYFIVIICT